MRQRVKRRLFLMSMALAAGASGHAFAKGGEKAVGEGHRFADAASDSTVFWPEAAQAARDSPGLLDRLGGALGAMRYGAAPESPPSAARGWRLDVLPAGAGPESGSDARAAKAKPFGLALRLAF
ncbi:MAG: hypothetical protein FJ209_12525 [Betaproteobacteria bacterium]|nr:hypothetical protein [Betaproteobacteria bacterium]